MVVGGAAMEHDDDELVAEKLGLELGDMFTGSRRSS